MERIAGPGATPDNLFTEGDPSLGIDATTVTANWLNGVQEELMSIIEKSFQVGDPAHDDQVLKGIFRMIRRENIALNGSFSASVPVLSRSLSLLSGVPARNLLNPPGWYLGGNLVTAGATHNSGELVNYMEPDRGFVNDVQVMTAGQYLQYTGPWAGFQGTLYAANGTQASQASPRAPLYLTTVLDVGNQAGSAMAMDVECIGFGNTSLDTVNYSVEVLESVKLTALAPGASGRVSLCVKITSLTGITSPIPGPVFRVTFNGTGVALYSFKNYAVYQGAFRKEYIPEYTPTNDAVDAAWTYQWCKGNRNGVEIPCLVVPLVQTSASTKDATGRISIPIPYGMGYDARISKPSGISGSTVNITAHRAWAMNTTGETTEGIAEGQSVEVAVPGTITAIVINKSPSYITLDVAVPGHSWASGTYTHIELDLVITWY